MNSPLEEGKGGGFLGYATDAECIAACLAEIARLRQIIRSAIEALPNDIDSAMATLCGVTDHD